MYPSGDISRVKISCFPTKAHLLFHWCLYNKTHLQQLKGSMQSSKLGIKVKGVPFVNI